MKAVKPPIVHADWMHALHDLGLDDGTLDHPEALTTAQLADIWSCSPPEARRRIAKLRVLGTVQQVSVIRRDVTGRTQHVAAYILLASQESNRT